MSQHTLDPLTIDDPQNWDHYFQNTVQSFWRETVVSGHIPATDGIPIAYYYALHPQEKGCIMLSSGRIEAALKYQELVHDLYRQGYSVFIHDHRGQGLSGRLTLDPQRGYVENFDDYVQDMHQFYLQVVSQHSQHQPMLVCHSMGSAVGALFQLAYPNIIKRVVYSAPMFGIKSPVPQVLARAFVKMYLQLNQKFSQQPWYFMGQGQYLPVPFPLNLLTHSKCRYQSFRDLYQQQPQLQLGGVTCHWLSEAIKAMDSLHQQAQTLTTPSMIIQAGNDLVVDNRAQDRLAEKMPNCQKRIIPSARHELFQESDQFRTQVMESLFDFLSRD